MSEEILFEFNAGIALLTVNRPQARNALNWSAQEQFLQVVRRCSENSKVRVLVITGAGEKAFIAGGDVKELANAHSAADGERLQQVMGTALAELTALPFPVIAAINGDAIGGGCEILTACDIRIAVTGARFRFAQVSLGLTTGWGGTGRLTRLIGQARASDWLLTGRVIEVPEAKSCGFVNYVVPVGTDLMNYAMNIANSLSQLPPRAVSATKALLNTAASRPLDGVHSVEKRLFAELWLEDDRLQLMRSIKNRNK